MPDYSPHRQIREYCLFREPATNFTTYRAGGRAEVLIRPADAEELLWLAAWCRAASLPLLVLGRGSNVLVSDRGLPGSRLPRLAGIQVSGGAVTAQAGRSRDR